MRQVNQQSSLVPPVGLTPVGAAATVVATCTAALTWPEVPAQVRGITDPDFPTVLQSAATVLLAGVAGWLLLVVVAGIARIGLPGVPRALRAAVFTGVAVTALVQPAHADATHDLSGLPLPDRPIVGASIPATAAAADHTSTVIVRSGDTLWSLVADRLGPTASNARIAAVVADWYHANRNTIGPDPDLILPGQVLEVVQS